jgi:hypothetical protein
MPWSTGTGGSRGTATWLFLGTNGHLLAEPLDENTAEQSVIDVVTGKLEIHQVAGTLTIFAARTPVK